MGLHDSPNFSLLDNFYSSTKQQLETLLNCEFASKGEVKNEDGTSRPSFVIISPGQAEKVLNDFLLEFEQ